MQMTKQLRDNPQPYVQPYFAIAPRMLRRGRPRDARFCADPACPCRSRRMAPRCFKQQCATCHTNNLTDPVRQGPTLFRHRRAARRPRPRASIIRRGFAKADFVWDEAKIDAWMTKPAGGNSRRRDGLPAGPSRKFRTAIIAYLKELH